jgi:hypothetical protein
MVRNAVDVAHEKSIIIISYAYARSWKPDAYVESGVKPLEVDPNTTEIESQYGGVLIRHQRTL